MYMTLKFSINLLSKIQITFNQLALSNSNHPNLDCTFGNKRDQEPLRSRSNE